MKLTVIIPTYNRSHLIKDSIYKILNQTYKNTYVVAVDDCSTDDTEKVLKEINHPRFQYFRNKVNIGADNTQYDTIQKIDTDFFTIVADDDEFINDNYFKTAMELAMKDNEIDIISAKTEIVFNNNGIINDFIGKSIYTSDEVLFNMSLFKQFGFGGCTLLKKTLMTSQVTQNEHDYATCFKLIYKAKKVGFINDMVFRWYTTTDGDTFGAKLSRNQYKHLEWDYGFISQIYTFLEKNNDLIKYKELINKHIFYMFDNIKMNYHLTHNNSTFSDLLNKLDLNKKMYIYGKGMVGLDLNSFLIQNNIYIDGFIDDMRRDENTINLNDIEKDSIVIIAAYKETVIHKMYKNLITCNISYKNIIELI